MKCANCGHPLTLVVYGLKPATAAYWRHVRQAGGQWAACDKPKPKEEAT